MGTGMGVYRASIESMATDAMGRTLKSIPSDGVSTLVSMVLRWCFTLLSC
jgi:hypothetical protein